MAFASIRRYKVDPANSDEIIRRAREGFVPIMKGSPGFVAYNIIDAGDGVLATISVFETQAEAEESNNRAASWVKENLAQLVTSPPEITEGEVVVSEMA